MKNFKNSNILGNTVIQHNQRENLKNIKKEIDPILEKSNEFVDSDNSEISERNELNIYSKKKSIIGENKKASLKSDFRGESLNSNISLENTQFQDVSLIRKESNDNRRSKNLTINQLNNVLGSEEDSDVEENSDIIKNNSKNEKEDLKEFETFKSKVFDESNNKILNSTINEVIEDDLLNNDESLKNNEKIDNLNETENIENLKDLNLNIIKNNKNEDIVKKNEEIKNIELIEKKNIEIYKKKEMETRNSKKLEIEMKFKEDINVKNGKDDLIKKSSFNKKDFSDNENSSSEKDNIDKKENVEIRKKVSIAINPALIKRKSTNNSKRNSKTSRRRSSRRSTVRSRKSTLKLELSEEDLENDEDLIDEDLLSSDMIDEKEEDSEKNDVYKVENIESEYVAKKPPIKIKNNNPFFNSGYDPNNVAEKNTNNPFVNKFNNTITSSIGNTFGKNSNGSEAFGKNSGVRTLKNMELIYTNINKHIKSQSDESDNKSSQKSQKSNKDNYKLLNSFGFNNMKSFAESKVKSEAIFSETSVKSVRSEEDLKSPKVFRKKSGFNVNNRIDKDSNKIDIKEADNEENITEETKPTKGSKGSHSLKKIEAESDREDDLNPFKNEAIIKINNILKERIKRYYQQGYLFICCVQLFKYDTRGTHINSILRKILKIKLRDAFDIILLWSKIKASGRRKIKVVLKKFCRKLFLKNIVKVFNSEELRSKTIKKIANNKYKKKKKHQKK